MLHVNCVHNIIFIMALTSGLDLKIKQLVIKYKDTVPLSSIYCMKLGASEYLGVFNSKSFSVP